VGPIRVGVDIVELERIRKAARRPRFLSRILTAEEQAAVDKDELIRLAASFALKEAAWKALPPCLQKKTYFHQVRVIWREPGVQLEIAGWRGKTVACWQVFQGQILALVILSRPDLFPGQGISVKGDP